METREVILKLGRKRSMETLGVSTSQISNVIAGGTFPAHWFDPLDQLAQKDGWKLPRELFAWKKRNDAA